MSVAELRRTVEKCRPDVLLLLKGPATIADWQRTLDENAGMSFDCIPEDQLPPSCQSDADWVVAVRNRGDKRKAATPPNAPGAPGRDKRPTTRRNSAPTYSAGSIAGRPRPSAAAEQDLASFSKMIASSASSAGSAMMKPSWPSLSSSATPATRVVTLGKPQAAASETLSPKGS